VTGSSQPEKPSGLTECVSQATEVTVGSDLNL
jgi:hypothetical protein